MRHQTDTRSMTLRSGQFFRPQPKAIPLAKFVSSIPAIPDFVAPVRPSLPAVLLRTSAAIRPKLGFRLATSAARVAPLTAKPKSQLVSFARPTLPSAFQLRRGFRLLSSRRHLPTSCRTVRTMALALMPNMSINSSGLPERGMSLTASLWTLMPSLLTALATASPIPPSG